MSSECDGSDGNEISKDGTSEENEGELTGPPSINTLFSALAHHHRRHALDCLREHYTMTLADVADEVAVSEYERPLDEIPAETVKQIYLSLYHKHIPKLESANLVEYDQRQDSVAVGEAIEQAAPFLALVEDQNMKAA